MEIQEQQVLLRKLIAGEGKVIISKEIDEETQKPILISKEVYLGKDTSADEFEEVDEIDYIEQ